jgi:hypothetical protein
MYYLDTNIRDIFNKTSAEMKKHKNLINKLEIWHSITIILLNLVKHD